MSEIPSQKTLVWTLIRIGLSLWYWKGVLIDGEHLELNVWNVVLAWVFWWSLVYIITGVHVQFFYIQSGLNLRGITIKKGHSTTTIRNLRLQLGWGSILIDVDKVETEIHSKKLKKRKRDTDRSTKRNSANNDDEANTLISVLPNNIILKKLGSFLIQRIPSINIRLKKVEIKLSKHQKVLFPFSKFTLMSKVSLKQPNLLKFYMNFFIHETCYTIVNLESTRLFTPAVIDIFRVQLSSMVNATSGNVSQMKSKLLVDDLTVNVFETFQFLHEVGLFDIDNLFSTIFADITEEDDHQKAAVDAPTVITKKQNKKPAWGWIGRFYSKVEDTDIRFQNIDIKDILLINFNEKFELKRLFTAQLHNSLNLNLKGLSINASRIHKTGAGYFILFNSILDYPFHFTLALQMFLIRYNHLYEDNSTELYEIFNLPSFSISNKANVLNHLVNGKGFKDSVIEFYAATGSPTVDIDTERLAIIIYNVFMLKKYIKVKQLQRLNNNAEALKKAVSVFENSIRKTKKLDDDKPPRNNFSFVMELLYQYYPRFNANITIEQPRLIICNKNLKDKKLHILTVSISQLAIHLKTTEDRNYDITGTLENLTTTYSEKSNSMNGDFTYFDADIFKLKTMSSKFMLCKNFMLSCHYKLSDAIIDMSQLRVMSGMNSIIDSYILQAKNALGHSNLNSDLDSMVYIASKKFLLAIKHMEELNTDTDDDYYYDDDRNDLPMFTSFKQSILRFQNLPDWLQGIDMEVSAIQVIIGSRSLLIPTSHLADTYDDGLNFDSTGESHRLKTIRMTLQSVQASLSKSNSPPPSTPSSPSLQSTKNSVSSTLLDGTTPPGSSEEEEGSTLNEDHWEAKIKLSKLDMTAKLDLQSSYDLQVISIPEIKGTIESVGSALQPFFKADFALSQMNIHYDKYKLFVIFGAVNLIREFFIRPLKSIRTKINREIRATSQLESLFQRPKRYTKSEINSLLDMVSWTINVDKTLVLIELSEDFSCIVQSFDSKLSYEKRKLALKSGFFRVLRKVDMDDKKLLSRAFCIDNLVVQIDEINLILFDPVIDIYSDGIRILQPSGSVVYRFFDNLSIQISILKCLVRALKKESHERSRVIYPSESKPVRVPRIQLKSKKIIYLIEDDPLEAEINMNYQLGLVEQRKRMELWDLFNAKVRDGGDNTNDNDKDYQQELDNLNRYLASSWIRKVKAFKLKFRKEIIDNRKHLFGNELKLQPVENEGIQPSYSLTPLLTMIFDDVKLRASKPKFDDHNDLTSFIHDMGSGVPYDSQYSILIPLYLDLKLSEFRMHLRDYPLPLVHTPSTKSELPGLHLYGNIVLAEQLLTSPEHMREILVSLAAPDPTRNNDNDNTYYSLLLKKSLATVKIYTDMIGDFNLDLPTRIVWGHSYEFALQQVMMNFDQFSKPPIDPSKKLGFWDKIRFIMHGNFTLRSQSAIEVAFKGSNDPYDVLETASGFILSFNDNVKWLINKSNNSLDFFDITSKKVTWYIPNYLVALLYVWSRESSKTVPLMACKEMVTSTFGYYLSDIASDGNVSGNANVLEKCVISIEGGISFQVGFLLERINSQGNTTSEATPHYEILLWNPNYCQANHDSYRGFRSDYVHMSISLKAANKQCYNCLNLSPGVFRQFFSWWKLFNGATLIPIRKGKLFGESQAKTKFSQHLSTIKYLFSINSIFIAHGYRSDASNTSTEDKIKCVGLRAKIDDFVVDLHQRKEQTNLKSEGQRMAMNLGEVHLSNIDLRIMNATFDQTAFEHENDTTNDPKNHNNKYSDEGWYDVDSFNEVFLPRIRDKGKQFIIKPFVFTKQFSYLRDTHSQSKFGAEENHNCTLFKSNVFLPQIEILDSRISQLLRAIQKKKSLKDSLGPRINSLNQYKAEFEKRWKQMSSQTEDTATTNDQKEFHNKFILINMLFKWNNVNRNCLYQYISLVKRHSSMAKYLSFASISTVGDMLDSILEQPESLNGGRGGGGEGNSILTSSSSLLNRGGYGCGLVADSSSRKGVKLSSKERLENFEQLIKYYLDNQTIQQDYELEIISPQIQLQSEQLEDSVILITAPKIDGKIVTVLDDQQNELETRYGILLPEASILMVKKSDLQSDDDDFAFSQEEKDKPWPPWLGIEVCRDVLLAKKSRILVDNLSVMLMYDMLKPMGTQLTYYHDNMNVPSLIKDPKGTKFIQERLQIDCPKLVISCTSEQYISLYIIVLNLLFYSEPLSKELQDQLEKLRFSLDLQNLQALYYRLCNLHKYNLLIKLLKRNYMFRDLKSDNHLLNESILLSLLENEITEEIYLLMRCILTGELSLSQSNSFHAKDEWFIQADQIIFHLLEDDRTPIVDFAMAKGRFSRIVNENGSNKNRIQVGMVQGFNLVKGTCFSTLIQPFYDNKDRTKWVNKDFLTVDWTMNKAVGGIKILENFEIDFQPLNVNLDAITGKKLIRYIFATDDSIEDSPLLQVNNTNIKEVDEDKAAVGAAADANVEAAADDDESNKKKSYHSLLNDDSDKLSSGSSSETPNDQVEEMIKRAGKYMSIGYFRISPVPVKISIQLQRYLRVLNVTDFVFNFPPMEINHQILSLYDITKLLKHSVIKTLVGHSSRLLLQKVTKSRKKKAVRQLKPILSYEEFRDVHTISSLSL
ncbi:uncharacterized protein KQ657_004353 [Scheffersomyces spartinae]|uniref:Uncharacterized protein n=1 Tax=Scheffersomyces spartinae TaxID=45513 RepID=A0A9P7VBW0_9ASCO|nr:uncharacterized protein KQ657_004353 [Scheffersomyces spartinae]KAG7194676.1 hypothetical protein KQ657_004353 [Scheffersomyces spartinae]